MRPAPLETRTTATEAGAEDRKTHEAGTERTRAPRCIYQKPFLRGLGSAAHRCHCSIPVGHAGHLLPESSLQGGETLNSRVTDRRVGRSDVAVDRPLRTV